MATFALASQPASAADPCSAILIDEDPPLACASWIESLITKGTKTRSYDIDVMRLLAIKTCPLLMLSGLKQSLATK